MQLTIRTAFLTAALLALPCHAQTNILRNSSFEGGGLAGWNVFGNVFAESGKPGIVPRTGSTLAKMFGQFTGSFNVGGIFQSFPAAPGDTFTMDCWSRHYSGDPLIGAGPPNDNWMVMKIAFFDATGAEITGTEATILDGTSPTDVWINNAPIMATAPAATVSVQALILFLQPAVDGGAGQVDDIFFTGGPDNPPYPGTSEDLVLTTGVGPGGTSGGNGNYIKQAFAGDLIECNVASPNGTYALAPYIMFAQGFVTGNPPQPLVLPSLYLDLSKPIILLVTGSGLPPLGAALIGPNGSSTFYAVPAGLTGNSVIVQALVSDMSAANGRYAATDAYEFEFK